MGGGGEGGGGAFVCVSVRGKDACVFVVRGAARVCERLFLSEERNSCWGGGRDLLGGGELTLCRVWSERGALLFWILIFFALSFLAGQGGGARHAPDPPRHPQQLVRRAVERTEQQNPQQQQELERAGRRAPVPEGGGAEEAAGGDPEQREGLRELLLLRETAMFPLSLTDGLR